MHHFQRSAAFVALIALSACDVSGFSGQAYPDRSQHSFQSADGANVLTYACQNGSNAASAHRYVDRAILSAERRMTDGSQSISARLGGGAGLNAEIARISREAEAEYRCILLNRKDQSIRNPFDLG